MIERTAEKRGASWLPVWLTGIGALLTMIDPTRHLLLDHDGVFFQPKTISMYSDDGSLSPVGNACMYSTRVGLVLLLLGVVFHMKLPSKIAKYCCSAEV